MMLADHEDRERAVTDLHSNLVVTAGAGTGKTSLLVERILFALLEAGVPLDRIAVITFTEKAASELRERLEESLERCLEIASEATTKHSDFDASHEAGRVCARLSQTAQHHLRERTQAALRNLDAAAVSTIHSFAAELLRRHHEAAGVDSHFVIDADDAGFKAVFNTAWEEFVDASLSTDTAAPPWQRLLGKLYVEDLESIALRLCRFDLPPGVLQRSSADVELRFAVAVAKSALSELQSIESEIEVAADGLNTNFRVNLDTLKRLLEETVQNHKLPEQLELQQLTAKPTPGIHSGVADPDDLRDRLGAVRRLTLELAAADLDAMPQLNELLSPFVEEVRRRYLNEGWLSHDATIRLTRDVLAHHPSVQRQEAGRYRQLLIDEFQDTDPVQYEIAFLLAAAEPTGLDDGDAFGLPLAPGRLFIVGDAKQSIYRFRGADISAYQKAVDAICSQGGALLTLATNFRSTRQVIEPLNRLFEHYFDDLAADDDSASPRYAPLRTQREQQDTAAAVEIWTVGENDQSAAERRRAEADAIAVALKETLASQTARAGDCAILLRALTEVDIYLRALRQCGIPYVVEGGKGFFERYEVELFVACLLAMEETSDPIPLLAYLRSPLGAVPDRELQEYALGATERRERWTLRAEPDPENFPSLARALASLREFKTRHLGEPLDRIALALLEETPLRIAMASSYEGAQRVANLEKAVLHTCELVQRGNLTNREILQHIQEHDAAENQEADSPLADESVDAVRVLSIHKSKGLEWPIVIIPDLSRDDGGPRFVTSQIGVVSLSRASTSDAAASTIYLRQGDVVTPSYFLHREEERRQAIAENARLFYVGTTRARDRLILLVGSGDAMQRVPPPWLKALRTWGYPDSLDNAISCDLAPGVRHVNWGKPKLPNDRPETATGKSLLLRAARAFGEARQSMGLETRTEFHSPSGSAVEGAPDSSRRGGRREVTGGDAATTQRAADESEADDGKLIGTTLHLLLEAWDGIDHQWLERNVERAVAVVMRNSARDSAAIAAAVRARLGAAAANGVLGELQKINVLGREVPLLFRDSAGRLWDGHLDLIGGTPDSPCVVDYKSNAGRSLEELRALYHEQLSVYTEGLRAALSCDITPPAKIVPLTEGEGELTPP